MNFPDEWWAELEALVTSLKQLLVHGASRVVQLHHDARVFGGLDRRHQITVPGNQDSLGDLVTEAKADEVNCDPNVDSLLLETTLPPSQLSLSKLVPG